MPFSAVGLPLAATGLARSLLTPIPVWNRHMVHNIGTHIHHFFAVDFLRIWENQGGYYCQYKKYIHTRYPHTW